nr:putative ribonuclease H-like domain-containing protein [Tanacetum cinerariifolium]
MLFPVWSSIGSINPQNNAEDAAFNGKEHDFDVKKLESKVILSPSSSAQSKEQDDKIMKEAKGKSLVESVIGYRDLNAEFQDCTENNSNEIPTVSSTGPTVGQNSLNRTNTFRLENIIYSDDEDIVGAEADFNNLESSIPEQSKTFDLVAYSDSDYAGASLDRKSTTRGYQFLRCRLISCQYKKQTVVATSSTKAKYVAAASCCAQFWNTVTVKQSNDVTRGSRLPAKRRDFAGLARMGYEKPSIKLTFYKAFFSSQWKKFNFSKYIFDSLVRNVESNSKFYMYLRVGKGCSRVETPLFEGILVAKEIEEQDDAEEQIQGNDNDAAQGADADVLGDEEALDACATLTRRVEHLEHDLVAQDLEITKLKTRVKKLERVNKEEEKKAEDVKVIAGDAQVEGRQAEIQAEIYQIDMDHPSKVLSMHEDEPEVQEVVEVVTTAKLITKVVTAASAPVSDASTIIPAVKPNIPAATITAAPVKDKGKGIMVEEPKPIKKKQQVEMDEAYARKLHEELNQDIDWDVTIDHVKQKAKEDPYVQRLDYFKGMSYDDIRPIFKAKFNSNIEFLLKSKEQIEEEENIALESINKTPAQKATKRRRLNEEDKDVEEIKQHLEIVPDEDDDVYTEATPLARKVTVIDYQIIQLNNKPRYKIIRADGTHHLYSNVWMTKWTRSSLEESKKYPWSSKERRYPLLRFTLDQMLNAVRLQVEKQSEMSLELISFGVDVAKELKEKHQVFNAAGEELCAAKQKLMLLD